MNPTQRILKGAQELFFRYGIKSITMDDIAKHLGISKKTIYQFFNDKNEVVHTLMQEKLKEDEKEFKCLQGEASNVVEEIFSFMKHMSTIFSQVNANAFYDMQKYHPKSWQLFREFKEKCVMQMVVDSLQKGIEQGLVRQDINTKILARLRMEELEMGFDPAVFPPDKFKVLDVQLALIEHFLYGVCTLKGHKLINKYKEITEEE